MSKTLKKVSDFLKLLLNTTKQQVKALFYTLTPLQTTAICEIIFNLQKLPLTKRVLKELEKRRPLLRKLSDNSLSISRRLALIQTHYRQVQQTLQLIKNELVNLVQ